MESSTRLKEQLRVDLRSRLKSLPVSPEVQRHLIQNLKLLFKDLKAYSTLKGGFYPSPMEPPITPLFQDPDSRPWAFPFIDKNQLKYRFMEGDFDDNQQWEKVKGVFQLKYGRWVNPNEMHLLLIPGVGFDRSGARLGRGQGYFDQFLAGYSGYRIGVAFECQLVDELPQEAWDQNIHFLVTEKDIHRFKGV
ncbi:MAG: 5-formyltetrahydrofolate cyclo-ligase [Bdellovibrionaceae bacterium]|nr:5-formyltetrahydrofolate cyclo-ligase [Pseudobdellovibrionaceae bacterium]MDW8190514.1 5-formyltetrahydrofolate cyclo-ligase [Pseudobdellovibrionaceae bacterium]